MITYLRKLIPQDFPMRLWYHKAIAALGVLRFGWPGRKLFCIGVTGTDGKTTTVQLITHILFESGLQVGMTSTQGFFFNGEHVVNTTHKTTLGRFGLQRLLAVAVKKGCTHVVVEVSSHALSQFRTLGVPFQRGVFTNLSREHLDYHKTMEEYARAKAKLFEAVRTKGGIAILNKEDAASTTMEAHGPAMKVWYGREQGDITAKDIVFAPGSTSLSICTGDQCVHLSVPLVGEGNVYNMLAAVATAQTMGVDFEKAVRALETFPGVPGRMEHHTAPNGVDVLIDYAVTPKALTSLYDSVRTFTKGRVIAVLGACGDRDQGKRPLMGEIVSERADMTIFTDEEPYTEDPMRIIRMLESGALQAGKEIGKDYTIIEDRGKAIREALMSAQPGDTVVITGMGDQDSMIIGTKMIPWSDREAVKQVFTSM